MDRLQATAAVLVAMTLAAGLVAGGLAMGRGMARFRSEVRTVTVKGLVEREVQSDAAEWRLGFRRAGNALPELYAGVRSDREAVETFLHEHGFRPDELEVQPTRAVDKLAQDYGDGRDVRLRYVVSGAIVVRTKNVAAVQAALAATDALVRSGVVLDTGETGSANPRFIVSGFNALRPQLLADATKNARATARQFAADSGARVGRIVSANQGAIQIFGSDGHDESAPYSPTSTPRKEIRVVSTFQFALD